MESKASDDNDGQLDRIEKKLDAILALLKPETQKPIKPQNPAANFGKPGDRKLAL